MTPNRAHIRSGRSRFALTTLPAGDYPTTEEIADESVFAIAQSELKRLIDLTQFAMARQDVRYYLNGLLLEVAPRGLRAVGYGRSPARRGPISSPRRGVVGVERRSSCQGRGCWSLRVCWLRKTPS